MNIIQLIIVALIVEAVWETAKMIWQDGKVNVDRLGTICFGILLAFGAKVDFLALVGIPLVIPYLGYVLTGLLISRGSNFVHDLWISIQNLSVKTTAISATPKAKSLAKVVKIIK